MSNKYIGTLIGYAARDTLTGYEGIITAEAIYASGLHRVMIERVNVKSGDPQEYWFDESRVEVDVDQPRFVI